MSSMDGLATRQQIKADSRLSTTPVVIFTGNDTEAEIDKAMATGSVTVLAKPPKSELSYNLLPAVENVEAPVEAIEIRASSVTASIHNELLVLAQTSAREIADDISRQVAAEIAEEIARHVCKLITNEVMDKHAHAVIERAIHEP